MEIDGIVFRKCTKGIFWRPNTTADKTHKYSGSNYTKPEWHLACIWQESLNMRRKCTSDECFIASWTSSNGRRTIEQATKQA